MTFPGLLPDTSYLYRVTVNGKLLGQGTFQTAKGPEDNRFSFVAFADSGVRSPDQLALASLMGKLDFSLAIIPGDVVYEEGYDPEFDPRYFLPYQNLINHVPFFPVVGDHDLVANGNGASFTANFFHPIRTSWPGFSRRSRKAPPGGKLSTSIILLTTAVILGIFRT